jgi:hypothetical protein
MVTPSFVTSGALNFPERDVSGLSGVESVVTDAGFDVSWRGSYGVADQIRGLLSGKLRRKE